MHAPQRQPERSSRYAIIYFLCPKPRNTKTMENEAIQRQVQPRWRLLVLTLVRSNWFYPVQRTVPHGINPVGNTLDEPTARHYLPIFPFYCFLYRPS